jgi:hypothetical protein
MPTGRNRSAAFSEECGGNVLRIGDVTKKAFRHQAGRFNRCGKVAQFAFAGGSHFCQHPIFGAGLF